MAPAIPGKGWLELPGSPGNQEYVQTTFDGQNRNFSYNYDKDMFTSLWVAYPLYSSVTQGSNSASWKWDPNIPDEFEINVKSDSYNVNYGKTDPTGYNNELEFYARGHQIPNADRKSSATMNSQVYYNTNSTPQIQNGFNGGIWETLESAIRNETEKVDTVYVVTGAAFQKVGESRNVTWILPQGEITSNTNKRCPVPNYYWKVLLKVDRDSSGKVTSASSVGFWFEHKSYKQTSPNDRKYNYYDDEFVVSVDQIEEWTGFDFFVNLPDGLERTAEKNEDWNSFQGF